MGKMWTLHRSQIAIVGGSRWKNAMAAVICTCQLPSSSGGLMDVRELQQADMHLIHDRNVISGFPGPYSYLICVLFTVIVLFWLLANQYLHLNRIWPREILDYCRNHLINTVQFSEPNHRMTLLVHHCQHIALWLVSQEWKMLHCSTFGTCGNRSETCKIVMNDNCCMSPSFYQMTS